MLLGAFKRPNGPSVAASSQLDAGQPEPVFYDMLRPELMLLGLWHSCGTTIHINKDLILLHCFIASCR